MYNDIWWFGSKGLFKRDNPVHSFVHLPQDTSRMFVAHHLQNNAGFIVLPQDPYTMTYKTTIAKTTQKTDTFSDFSTNSVTHHMTHRFHPYTLKISDVLCTVCRFDV